MKNSTLAILCTIICLVSGPSNAQQQNSSAPVANPPAPIWEGVWVAEKSFGPRLQGPVTLHQSGESWIARLQGETTTVNRHKTTEGMITWSFAFLGQGRFEGQQNNMRADIEGHWMQPPGMVQNYPFATPVQLEPSGENGFSGEIAPFPQKVSLNIPLVVDTDETTKSGTTTYRTFLRNPQRNLGVWFRIETATVEGDEIRFANRDGETLATGQSIEPGERFTLLFPRFGETYDFTRRSRQDAPGFYPRRSPESPSTLPQPVEIGDGWSTASPRDAGLYEQPLAELVGSIAAFEPTGLRQPYIHGLLLSHRGKLVVEEYFHGFHREIPHDSRSAAKSITAALLGIAIHKGAIADVDQPIYPMFGGVNAFANPDLRKERITLRHLVSMSPGLSCDDGDYDSPGNEDTMQSQNEQPDYYQYALDLPMVREPGEAGFYCTAGMNLIGGAIRKATGISLMQFFREEFAKPLGISYYQLNLSPTDDAYMGGGIRLRPRDFLKLGQLYLNEGVWNGKRIISKEWVQESAASHSSLNQHDDYGFGWWRKSYDVNGRTIETYYASGNGGQLLFVAPELELVALIQAGNYSDGRTRNEFRDRFMRESILPAALAGK